MIRAPTTRMGLLEVRARRGIAAKGARLLRAKREVLAGELWKLTRDVLAGRSRLDEVLREAVKALGIARAVTGEETLASLADGAGREIPLEVKLRRVWGVPTPTVSAPALVRAADARGASAASYGATRRRSRSSSWRRAASAPATP